jgi:hypothetical protein
MHGLNLSDCGWCLKAKSIFTKKIRYLSIKQHGTYIDFVIFKMLSGLALSTNLKE